MGEQSGGVHRDPVRLKSKLMKRGRFYIVALKWSSTLLAVVFRWTYRQGTTLDSGDYRLREMDSASTVPIRTRTVVGPGYSTMSNAVWCHNWFSEIVFWDTSFETNIIAQSGHPPTLYPPG